MANYTTGRNLFIGSAGLFDLHYARLTASCMPTAPTLIDDASVPSGKSGRYDIVCDQSSANRGFYWMYIWTVQSLDRLAANETYTFSVYVKASANANLVAAPMIESQTPLSTLPSAYNITTDWQRIVIPFRWTSTGKLTTCFYLCRCYNDA